jgi:hypothetical protein
MTQELLVCDTRVTHEPRIGVFGLRVCVRDLFVCVFDIGDGEGKLVWTTS